MRLFIAIRFPENIKAALTDSMADLRRRGVSGNYSRVENLHLTLAFLGEVQSPKRVCKAMARVGARPFTLTLGGCGSFGDIFWVGLERCPELEDYVGRLRAGLRDDGIWFDQKAFRPHITMIRRAGHTENVNPMLRKESFQVGKISLMKSERINGKLVYTEIYSSKLS